MKTSVILLAGGIGKRMGRKEPKQFISLNNKPISHYSLEVFFKLTEVKEIIVVCDPQYRSFFAHYPVKFAPPGKERQDSVYNGLLMVDATTEWVTVHDAVRPFITEHVVRNLFDEAGSIDAAALAMPVKNTLKEVNEKKFVNQTIDRAFIWEIQTPQIIKKNILELGFSHIHKHGLSVTDDISVAEVIGYSAKLILGNYQNIKITTPEDLDFASWLIQKRN